MPYATMQGMVSRFGLSEVIALTDREANGAVDEPVLGAALVEATAEIEGYLAGRYALPLASVPPLVAGLCCDIARYRLSGANVLETDPTRNRYRDAVRLLEQISAGKVGLGLDLAGQPAPTGGGVHVRQGERSFPAGSLKDW
ncbi:MAG: gp436 family protein [Desulfovibrio sp.]|jgi:phage gp36-like protein